MKINLSELNIKNYIDINEIFNYSKLGTTQIKKTNDISFYGTLFYNNLDEIILKGDIKGEIILEDAIDLSDYYYNVDIEMEEVQNPEEYYIDIKEEVWKQIVLNLPIRATTKKIKVNNDGSYEIENL